MRHKKYSGFTLSEVLISLVIIGVLAVITVIVCMDNYRKVSVPAKLEKFYSVMNNALRLWYIDSGNYAGTYSFDSSDFSSGSAAKSFYQSSFGKYLIDVKEPVVSGKSVCTAFNDGSGFCGYIRSANIFHFFYCTEYKYCKNEVFDGKNTFLFTLNLNTGKVVTSSDSFDNKTREYLLNACKYGNTDDSSVSSKNRRHACARLIQVDGWQIKSDYPWRQTFK